MILITYWFNFTLRLSFYLKQRYDKAILVY